MANVTESVNVCTCSDSKCVNKSVHEENLGYNDQVANLQSYNAYGNRKANDVINEKTDKEIYDKDAAAISIVPSTPGNLQIGGQIRLAVEPTVFTKNPPVVVWESSDLTIAHVDSEGVVYAHKAGSVTIKATNFENTAISAQVNITVV